MSKLPLNVDHLSIFTFKDLDRLKEKRKEVIESNKKEMKKMLSPTIIMPPSLPTSLPEENVKMGGIGAIGKIPTWLIILGVGVVIYKTVK